MESNEQENGIPKVEATPKNDLQSRFAEATQEKTPGASKQGPKKTGFWNASDDDFDIPEPKKTEPVVQQSATGKPEEITDPVTGKPVEKKPVISSDVADSSATVAVGMMNLATRTIISPIHTYKLKKNINRVFTEEQQLKLESTLILADESKLEPEDKKMKSVFDLMMAKYNKKINRIEYDAKEKKEMHQAFFEYFKITGKSIPPETLVIMEVITKFGSRIADAAMD